MKDRRILRSGYYNLGPILIPSYSPAFVLTDRDTGVKYLVSYNSTNPEHLSINTDFSTIQRQDGVTIYGPNDGPVMDEDGQFILMVRGGKIGFDYRPFPIWERAADNAPPYARQIRTQRQLFISTLDLATLRIGYRT